MRLYEEADQPRAEVDAADSGGRSEQEKTIGKGLYKLLTEKLESYVIDNIIKMAERNEQLLVEHLKKPTRSTAMQLGNMIATDVVKEAAIELMDVIPGIGTGAGMITKVGLKLGGDRMLRGITGKVSEWIAKHLVPGDIPDNISSKSRLLRSFDLPDNISSKLDEDQKANLMIILNILRNKPKLFATEWNILNSLTGVKSSPTGGQSLSTSSRQVHTNVGANNIQR